MEKENTSSNNNFIDGINKQIEEAETLINEKVIQMNTSGNEFRSEAKTKLSSILIQIEDINKRLRDIFAKIKGIQDSMTSNVDQVVDLQKQIENLEKEKTELENDKNKLGNDIANKDKTIAEQNSKTEALQSENNRLEQQFKINSGILKDQIQKITKSDNLTKQEAANNINEVKENFEKAKAEYEAQITDNNNTITQLKGEKTTLESENNTLNGNLDELKNKINETSTQETQTSEKMNSLEIENDKMKQLLDTVSKKLNPLVQNVKMINTENITNERGDILTLLEQVGNKLTETEKIIDDYEGKGLTVLQKTQLIEDKIDKNKNNSTPIFPKTLNLRSGSQRQTQQGNKHAYHNPDTSTLYNKQESTSDFRPTDIVVYNDPDTSELKYGQIEEDFKNDTYRVRAFLTEEEQDEQDNDGMKVFDTVDKKGLTMYDKNATYLTPFDELDSNIQKEISNAESQFGGKKKRKSKNKTMKKRKHVTKKKKASAGKKKKQTRKKKGSKK